jgi:hypothetical protein
LHHTMLSRKAMKALGPWILGIVFTVIALKDLPVPYLWICLCWLACSLVFTRRTKALGFTLAFLCFAFGFLEAFSWRSLQAIRFEGGYSEGYVASDEILGYAPIKRGPITAKKYQGTAVVYDVTYNLGAHGLRRSSPDGVMQAQPCVVFFGDSLTFGEGVEDDEAMPYLVSHLTKAKVYNFGFHGYGPHQMLAALEHGLVQTIVECTPRLAIYQAFVGHVARAAGLAAWDRHGPKYLLLSDGTLTDDGHFDDHTAVPSAAQHATFMLRVEAQLKKSFIYKKYLENYQRRLTEQDVKLFLAIMDASRRKFITTYPGSAFHAILWDYNPNDPSYKMMVEGLRTKEFPLHFISSILPQFSNQPSRYQIIHDGHPNALAYRYIAHYIVETILEREAAQKTESLRSE